MEISMNIHFLVIINIKTSSCSNLEGLDIEGLTEMKEHIEDLIAEKSATESAEEIIVAAE